MRVERGQHHNGRWQRRQIDSVRYFDASNRIRSASKLNDCFTSCSTFATQLAGSRIPVAAVRGELDGTMKVFGKKYSTGGDDATSVFLFLGATNPISRYGGIFTGPPRLVRKEMRSLLRTFDGGQMITRWLKYIRRLINTC